MCGIAGLLDARAAIPDAALSEAASAMAQTLAHRGPDDTGVWVDGAVGVGLGFRRLAIIDLSSTGHQPMCSADGRYVLVFNGEIYNHVALRAELHGSGIAFRGRSDTEVLLEAIAAWGLDRALTRANGMFAFACWDRQSRALFLARDRFGEKPLYYGWCGEAFLFGSELRALRAHPSFRAEIDRDALADYFRFGYVPTPQSIYRGIRKLPPATSVGVDPKRPGALEEPRQYWSATDEALGRVASATPSSREAAADAVEVALGESVALRMVADVPVGAFLSGGTDSSLVVALMQARSARPVRTFTIGFDLEGYDESERAREVAEHLGTDHTELCLTASEVQSVVPRLPLVFDEPFADSSQMPTLLVSDLARRDVTVALSGDGGDELFGGYARYRALEQLQRTARWPAWVRGPIASLLESQPPRRWDRASRLIPWEGIPAQPGDKLHKLARSLRATGPEDVYPALVACWDEPVVLGEMAPASVAQAPSAGSLPPPQWAMLVDTLSYLPDDLLTKVDRSSMADGLEARIPMLDPGVFTVAWRLSASERSGRSPRKRVLRDVLRRHLPERLVGGPKSGFAVPFGDWLRGPLRPWAGELLSEQRLRAEGYLDPTAIRRHWQEHLAGTRDHRHRLWAVLMFEAWLEAAT